jgi:hypothetical protein
VVPFVYGFDGEMGDELAEGVGELAFEDITGKAWLL